VRNQKSKLVYNQSRSASQNGIFFNKKQVNLNQRRWLIDGIEFASSGMLVVTVFKIQHWPFATRMKNTGFKVRL
jgi:hypothetical protein